MEELPSECLLIPAPLPPMGGYSPLRMVLTVTYGAVLPTTWVADLAALLCVEPSKIAVYEYAQSSSGEWEVVVAVQCGLMDSCSTSLTISAVNCAVNHVSSALAVLAAALLNETGITGCSVRDSSISTANTTYHAASSSNILSPTEVAIVSSTAAVVGGGIAAAIVFGIIVWRRRQIAESFGALHVRFFHSADMFSDASERPSHADTELDAGFMDKSKNSHRTLNDIVSAMQQDELGSSNDGHHQYIAPSFLPPLSSGAAAAAPPADWSADDRDMFEKL